MAKWAGKLGFAEEIEVEPGIWEKVIIEKNYYGDFVRNSRSLNNASEINEGITMTNQISLISDPYATENFHKLRYATYMGTKWKAKNVSVEYPRLLITLGDVYNEQQQSNMERVASNS